MSGPGGLYPVNEWRIGRGAEGSITRLGGRVRVKHIGNCIRSVRSVRRRDWWCRRKWWIILCLLRFVEIFGIRVIGRRYVRNVISRKGIGINRDCMESELLRIISEVSRKKRDAGLAPSHVLFVADILPALRRQAMDALNELVKKNKIVWHRTINDDAFEYEEEETV